MEISEIFENLLKIEPKVMSIESLFNNPDRVNKTNYKPSYQRNYVWDDEKATYFIESIFLGTEIPPLIYFRNSDKVEVVDGRQRYQTILRFIHNEFKLKKNGLQKLAKVGIANKYFKNIDSKLVDLFWDTKLRIIEFSFHSKNFIDDEIEEVVKKEIFKRYNSGITPLKPTEIDKAAYISDNLNSLFKTRIVSDKVLYGEVSSLLHFEKSNEEIIMKKIRQLLVLHQIPIKYYSVRKESVISKYFDFLSSNLTDDQIEGLYESFIRKINLLIRVRSSFVRSSQGYNRLVFECLFWAFSIMEEEKIDLKAIDEKIVSQLCEYINANIDAYKMERSSFSEELHTRYLTTSEFFAKRFNIDFAIYLQTNSDFKAKNKEIASEGREMTSFEELRINKPEPSSIAIDDICRQMDRQRFLIRPPYQRNEVINKRKSSAIIESILLGIKLPPIFVYKREDDISEVLDGQQRLLSILGYIQAPYLDERNEKRNSDKDGYALNLKNGILKKLNGKKFEQLSKEDKEKIKNFDLWIIEISQKNNKNFESIDLFIRLNNKPYPIKEDTFEMWNSYVSRDIIDSVKSIYKNNVSWFYLRKNKSRMEDENIYTALIYMQHSANVNGFSEVRISKDLDIYKIVDKINFRIKSKVEITKLLEAPESKEGFIQSSFDFEFNFLGKLKELLVDPSDDTIQNLNKNLDFVFNKDSNRRTQQSFYALWYFLYEISLSTIIKRKTLLRRELKKLFKLMDGVESKAAFDKAVLDFRSEFQNESDDLGDLLSAINNAAPVELGSVSSFHSGVNLSQLTKYSSIKSSAPIPFYREISLERFRVSCEDEVNVMLDDQDQETKDCFDNRPKILIKKQLLKSDRFSIGYTEKKFVFSNDIICVHVSRFGYDPKFIACILNSRLIHFWVKNNTASTDVFFKPTMKALRMIPVPIISLSRQIPFIKVLDFLQVLDSKNAIGIFYERVLDLMVYELYFRNQMVNGGCEVIRYMEDIPSLDSIESDLINIITDHYELISSSSHPISASLLKVLNVPEIVQIEGNVF